MRILLQVFATMAETCERSSQTDANVANSTAAALLLANEILLSTLEERKESRLRNSIRPPQTVELRISVPGLLVRAFECMRMCTNVRPPTCCPSRAVYKQLCMAAIGHLSSG